MLLCNEWRIEVVFERLLTVGVKLKELCVICVVKDQYTASFFKAAYDRCVSVSTGLKFPEQPTVVSCTMSHRAITYTLLLRDARCKVLYETVAEEGRIALQRVYVLVLIGECADQAVNRTMRNVE